MGAGRDALIGAAPWENVVVRAAARHNSLTTWDKTGVQKLHSRAATARVGEGGSPGRA